MENADVIVLVVDDEEILLEFMSSALADGGYKTLLAGSFEDADRLIAEHSKTLGGLVTDINLGGDNQTGWDVAKRAREANPVLPVVYVTGTSADDWPSRGVPHSVLLRKPYTSTDLLFAIASRRKIE